MKYNEILAYAPIHDYVDQKHVMEIANSIKANGWQGMPILVHKTAGCLITGCHRLAALQLLDQDLDWDGITADVSEAVDEIVEAYCEANDCTLSELPYDNLRAIFAGTWVEEYKAEMVEW